MGRRRARAFLLAVLFLALALVAAWDTGALRWVRQSGELALAGRFRKEAPGPGLPRAVAHAGGEVGGIPYSNSLEALENSAALGHTVFEVDLQWTRDNRLVLLHDWDHRRAALFPGSGTAILTRAEFLALRMRDGLTPVSVEALMEWLERHPGARIVTDAKARNLEALERIARDFPAHLPRIIPQIYSFREYTPVRAMGYGAVLLTLYRNPYLDGPVLRFARTRPLAGVVMPAARAAGPLPAKLSAAGVPAFAHTVNDPAERDRLEANGVHGVFTDTLAPERR